MMSFSLSLTAAVLLLTALLVIMDPAACWAWKMVRASPRIVTLRSGLLASPLDSATANGLEAILESAKRYGIPDTHLHQFIFDQAKTADHRLLDANRTIEKIKAAAYQYLSDVSLRYELEKLFIRFQSFIVDPESHTAKAVAEALLSPNASSPIIAQTDVARAKLRNPIMVCVYRLLTNDAIRTAFWGDIIFPVDVKLPTSIEHLLYGVAAEPRYKPGPPCLFLSNYQADDTDLLLFCRALGNYSRKRLKIYDEDLAMLGENKLFQGEPSQDWILK